MAADDSAADERLACCRSDMPGRHVRGGGYPPLRRKVQVGSGAFKLYCYPPAVVVDGGHKVDAAKLTRRIAPGLVQMLDSRYASIVVSMLHHRGIDDVVAIHDAFLVRSSAFAELQEVLDAAGEPWLRESRRPTMSSSGICRATTSMGTACASGARHGNAGARTARRAATTGRTLKRSARAPSSDDVSAAGRAQLGDVAS
jgi:hypothetical protein